MQTNFEVEKITKRDNIGMKSLLTFNLIRLLMI